MESTSRTYTARDFRSVGITEFKVECGRGSAREDSEIYGSFIIDFKQFIPHRDNVKPHPVIGNSLTVSNLEHRIIEAKTLDEAFAKMIAVAKLFFDSISPPAIKSGTADCRPASDLSWLQGVEIYDDSIRYGAILIWQGDTQSLTQEGIKEIVDSYIAANRRKER